MGTCQQDSRKSHTSKLHVTLITTYTSISSHSIVIGSKHHWHKRRPPLAFLWCSWITPRYNNKKSHVRVPSDAHRGVLHRALRDLSSRSNKSAPQRTHVLPKKFACIFHVPHEGVESAFCVAYIVLADCAGFWAAHQVRRIFSVYMETTLGRKGFENVPMYLMAT